MNFEKLSKIQSAQMRVMDEIHRICCEHNYRYYLIGGSALGAVRHKGIIPWDVDIDIAMPRKDYEEFSNNANTYLSECFELHDYVTDIDFGTVHALVVLKDSKMIFKHDMDLSINNRFGIFVDILPLDQFPDNADLKNKQIKDIKKITYIRSFYQGNAICRGDSFLRKLAKRSVQYYLQCVTSIHALNKKQQEIVSKYHTEDEGSVWCSMLSHYSIEELTMPKEYFGTPKLMDFSGRKYYVPEKVELYLKHLFRDYMSLPPESSQLAQVESVHYAEWTNEDGERIIIK